MKKFVLVGTAILVGMTAQFVACGEPFIGLGLLAARHVFSAPRGPGV